ncbi:Isoleucyl-tRNA synthetase [Raineyella antarctica]|uniref:Isoleucine--tRNA ligase n=1 Tax=Raineyella antarctica TaxID=1577474 RepID=A0A1G6GFW3_9ACTN|nr:isoleucine--tRNA ligase [Raineyella antarctica]SDB80779.1 Isoleucyl-tRNA synthetase [Raineyella antarctica]
MTQEIPTDAQVEQRDPAATVAHATAEQGHYRGAYHAVPAQIDLPGMEHQVLDFWAANDVFAKSEQRTAGGDRWTFYEGPPTANGMPGTHHIEARVFKDIFPRFRTMQGYYVERKAGWDCHGLPVELAVEKELGINGKPQIEDYGIEAFNARCRESVTRHVDAFAELTDRMGYWVHLDDAYRTMDTSYIESVWWSLKQVFDKGMLSQDQRVAPYCPRCGTTLSDHELAQGYENVVDTTAFVRFPVTSGPYAGKADLVIWTTTPWTLFSNTTVAVGADITYVTATDGDSTVIVAEDNVATALGEGWTVQDRFTGAQMEGWTYSRPFDVVEQPGRAWFVVLEDYVATGEGTGLVHQAMPFGEDDFRSSKRNGIEFVNPIGPDGHFHEGYDVAGGKFFKDADKAALVDLKQRGLLFRTLDHEHPYPHCWRCHTPLMYYAQPSWYVRTTTIKDELLRENEGTTWYPETIKWGRYGDWLNNNVDWALSRTRYWGTPLPIWVNDATGDTICVGSRAELGELAGRDLSDLDPHRPFIDDVTFTKDGEEGTYRRVPEVIDAWYDSGSMPFAQWGYPYAEGSKEAFANAYPADFICEATDQTRGWFYSLMAVGTSVFDRSSYKNVLCLGHILAEDGKKMSKHLGNILEPIPLMDKHGADAVRWFMAASGSPWAARRVGDTAIQEIVRKVLLTYWNSASFLALYANANGWAPENADGTRKEVPLAERPVLDRWLVSETNVLVGEVTAALEDFDSQRAGQLLADFVDNLSNWYVRRSRRRFWRGEDSALLTLHDTMEVLTRLMAPMVPFLTEHVWQQLVVPVDRTAAPSVHLTEWPVADESVVNKELDEAMALTRRVVELGRGARAEAKVKIRQPLSRLLVSGDSYAKLHESLRAEISDELNVQEIASFASAGDLVDYSAKGNFRNLGKRFGKQTPLVAAAIASCDAAALHEALVRDGKATVDFEGGTEVGPDDVLIAERPREGWSVLNEQGETVALDLELTPELVSAGVARDVIREVQEARKNSGFEVSDRIELVWAVENSEVGQATGAAVREHMALIADEVLATEMREDQITQRDFFVEELGLAFVVTRLG